MSPEPYHIRSLEINRMPGFTGGLRLEDPFSPQLNIIVGPNASGKSSLARAIQKTIWQHQTGAYQVLAIAKLGKDTWQFDVNANSIRTQQNGQVSNYRPPLAEDQQRYLLALQDLVSASETDLANMIYQQLSGGYDLNAAAGSLNFNATVNTSRITECGQLSDSVAEVQTIQREQEELKEQEEQRFNLKEKVHQIVQQLRSEDLYKTALEYRRAAEDQMKAQLRFDDFPAELEHLDERDLPEIESWEGELKTTEQHIKNEETVVRQAEEDLKHLALPAEGLTEDQKVQFEAVLSELEELAQQHREDEKALNDATAKLEQAAESIELQDPETEWEGLRLAELKPLEEAWNDCWQNTAKVMSLQSELERVEEQQSEIPADLPEGERLTRGIQVLSSWLQAQSGGGDNGVPEWTIYALGALAVLGALAAVFLPVTGLVVVVAILAGILIYFARQKNKGTSDAAETYRREFEKLDLKVPEAWETEHVTRSIEYLNRQLSLSSERSALKDKARHTQKELESVEAKLAAFQTELDRRREALGLAPVDTQSRSLAEMYWLLHHARTWEAARENRQVIRKRRDHNAAQTADQLDAFNALQRQLQRGEVQGFKAARESYRALVDADQKRKEIVARLAEARRKIEREKDQYDKLNRKIDAVFKRVGMPNRDKYALRQLHNQLADYTEAERALDHARRKAEGLELKFKALPGFAEHQSRIEAMTEGELENQIEAFGELRRQREELLQDAAQIEALVDKAQRGRELEKALRQQEQAFDALESKFEENLEKVTGAMVVDALRSAHHEKNESELFQHADELFRFITQHHYRLDISEGTEKAFRAYDLVRQRGLSLEELSTGTRIQLLLAVRLAFIETQEKQYRLPLLVDELLANADDTRAVAIIDALVAISRSGRQVFYFTAQSDEVNKWRAFLDTHPDVEFRAISLDGKSGTKLDVNDLPEMTQTEETVPKPAGRSHREYGDAIDVDRFNLLQHPVEKLHLWYLVDDPQLLYAFLRHRIRYWGQVKSMGADRPVFAEERWPEIKKTLSDRAKLVGHLQELFKIGRAQPIHRGVLEASDAFSEKLLDPVTELLAQLGNDPLLLLEQVKSVNGVGPSRVENFREYLDQQELLPLEDEPLGESELKERLYTHASVLGIAPEEVDELVSSLAV